MTVKQNVTYQVNEGTASASFSAPADLTLAELQTLLQNTLNITLTDAQWDALVAKKKAADMGAKALPDWATYTPAQARDAVVAASLGGMNQTQFEAWVDTNVTVANIAQLKASLKYLGDEMIKLRNIMSLEAMMLMYLRDLLI